MLGWSIYEPILWTIDRNGAGGATANQRVNNISLPNPLRIPPWFLYGTVALHVSVNNGFNITDVRIYGSDSPTGFPPPGSGTGPIPPTALPIPLGQGVGR